MLFNPRTHPSTSALYGAVTRQWAEEMLVELERETQAFDLSREALAHVKLPDVEHIEDEIVVLGRPKARAKLRGELYLALTFISAFEAELAETEDILERLPKLVQDYDEQTKS